MSAPLLIADLAAVLHVRSNPWKAMALLRAYFDESGLHGNSRVTGVSGFISDANSWVELEDKWTSLLTRIREDTGRDIREFHACVCDAGDEDIVRNR